MNRLASSELTKLNKKILRVIKKAVETKSEKYCNVSVANYQDNLFKWYIDNHVGKFVMFKYLHEIEDLFKGFKYKVILGNYGYTPEGVHNDPDIIINHIMLEGRKEIYFYDDINPLLLFTSPDKIKPTFIKYLKKGDNYMMNGDVYHIACSPYISLDLVIYYELETNDN